MNSDNPIDNGNSRLSAGLCVATIIAGSIWWLSRDGSSAYLYVYKRHGFELMVTNGVATGVLLTSDAAPPMLIPGSLALRVNTHGFKLGMTVAEVIETAKQRDFKIVGNSGNRDINVSKETQITLDYNGSQLVDQLAVDGDFGTAMGFQPGSAIDKVVGVLGKPDYKVKIKKAE